MRIFEVRFQRKLSLVLKHQVPDVRLHSCHVMQVCTHRKTHLYPNRYDTGTFTTPPGGAGLYYFSTYLLVDEAEWAYFGITLNGQQICRAAGDQDNNAWSDFTLTSCSALAQLQEGEKTHPQTHVYTHTRTDTHMHIHTRTHAHTRTHTDSHTHLHTHKHTHPHTHARAHTHTHAHPPPHTHTHTACCLC